MKARLITHTHVACPNCGEEAGRVDHLFPQAPVSTSWYCDSCGREYAVKVNSPAEIEVEVRDGQHIDTHDLLMIPPRDTPVYFVVKGMELRRPGDTPEDAGSKQYLYEEHSCPTNHVRCEAIISDGDEDPHGVFEFVRSVPSGDDEPETWAEVFPEVATP